MSNNDNIRMRDRSWSQHMWERIKTWLTGLDERVTDLEEGGGGGGGGGEMNVINAISFNGVNVPPVNKRVSMSETDPTVPSWAKAAQKPSYTAAEVGAKALQTAVSDPTASGETITFIDSISQNSEGVISPTKKTVREATQALSGLMASTDKAKLDGIESGAQVNSITGVKGNAEASYRTGDVNLTPEDIGAAYYLYVPGGLTTAPQIYGVLDTLPRGNVATIVTRADASYAMCGVRYDMNGTIWRNPSSDSNNFYLSMTRTTGNEQYCYMLTLTASSMSHGTVYKYTGTAV